MDFLLFHVGVIIVCFTLSSILVADGDSMLGMFQKLKIELINSTSLHGTRVVCNWFSTNWFCYDCAYVFDLKLQLICSGKESGVCWCSWSVAQYIALLRIAVKKIYILSSETTLFFTLWSMLGDTCIPSLQACQRTWRSYCYSTK